MFRISRATCQNLHNFKSFRAPIPLHALLYTRLPLSRKVSTVSKSDSTPTATTKGKTSQLLEYDGPLTQTYGRLKAFSLTSLALAAGVTPLMFIIDSSVSTGGRAMLGLTALSTSGLSTALIAWAGKSYVTKLRVVEEPGTRLRFTTKNVFLRERITTVYDPLFLEPAEEYLTKVRLKKSVRIPMEEVKRLGMNLNDGMEETVAETTDSKGNVKGWWEVHWRREGSAGFVGECRGAGSIISAFNIDPKFVVGMGRLVRPNPSTNNKEGL
ncbi:hypothetical protein FRC16_004603 [Serendipita sp. 398]|nr:hypothetical protein FRC16_004603 [Serendipita sp. 398]KAG8816013.1 hypothetical protein FRC18_001208 [Serendipita sp. 400]